MKTTVVSTCNLAVTPLRPYMEMLHGAPTAHDLLPFYLIRQLLLFTLLLMSDALATLPRFALSFWENTCGLELGCPLALELSRRSLIRTLGPPVAIAAVHANTSPIITARMRAVDFTVTRNMRSTVNASPVWNDPGCSPLVSVRT